MTLHEQFEQRFDGSRKSADREQTIETFNKTLGLLK